MLDEKQKQAKITLSHLKGNKRCKTHTIELEAAPGLGIADNPIYGKLDMCPFQVFKRMLRRSDTITSTSDSEPVSQISKSSF